jgi:AraC family transcriptional regulator
MSHTSLDDPRVALDRVTEHHAASVRTTTQLHRLRHTIDSLHELVMCVVGEQGLAPAGPLFARFHQIGGAIAIEAGMPLAQPITATGVVLPSSLPGGPVLQCRYYGTLEELAAVRDTMARLRRVHGLTAAGAPWESYLIDHRDVFDGEDRVTEVTLPVRSTVARCSGSVRRPVGPGRTDRAQQGAIR